MWKFCWILGLLWEFILTNVEFACSPQVKNGVLCDGSQTWCGDAFHRMHRSLLGWTPVPQDPC